jgi:flagellar biosynthesis GTPase FlhF
MTTKTNEPNAIALLRQGVYVPDAADCGAILAAYDAIVVERDAAVRERDAYFDDWKCAVGLLDEARDVAHENAELAGRAEAESDTLRARLEAATELEEEVSAANRRLAAVRERDEARDKNVELHNLVRKYKNKATKQSQKQKKNYKLAKYADESNATLRARLAACERVVEAAEAYYEEWRYNTYDDALVRRDLLNEVRAYRAALAAATQTTPHAGGTDA